MNFFTSLKHRACKTLLAAGLLASLGAQAQAVWDIATRPLLGGDNLVGPNLILMFDDSSSMTSWMGTQYAHCMDSYNLIGRFYPSTDPAKGFLWRNCSLYGNNMRTPFDFGRDAYFADPTRLSGVYPYRDLRTLATFSSTFNPLYYNPDVRYTPWPGWPNSNPKAARPLATDPPVKQSNGSIKPLATSTFNLVNNQPLKIKNTARPKYVYYNDENNPSIEVKFPPEFPVADFLSNVVVAPYISANSTNGYNAINKLVMPIPREGYVDSAGGKDSIPTDGCFKYDGPTKTYTPLFTEGWPDDYTFPSKISVSSYNSWGGVLHNVFSDDQYSIIRPNDTLCTPRNSSYKVYRSDQVSISGSNATQTSAFFIAQYVKFTGNPWSDTDVTDMSKYVTVKIDSPATSFPPSPFVKSANRTDCADATKCTLAEEQTNFANWFTYYKTKRGMAIGTIAQAFEKLPDNFRVGWGRLSQGASTIDGQSTKYLVSGVRPWDATTKQRFMDWIPTMGNSGSTALREELEAIGNYFMRTDKDGPWSSNPGSPSNTEISSAHLSCRRNYHITVTDGAWTTYALPDAVSKRGNVDGGDTQDPAINYVASKPFSDTNSNTLADISMYYWAKDLRPDLANTVNTTYTDPANWQHLTNYYLMLNLSKNISGDSLENLDPDLLSGTKVWSSPHPVGNEAKEQEKIDDTLHAAINSRGRLFHVDGPESVVNAIKKIQDDMTSVRNGTDAQVQISGQYLSTTSKKFTPRYFTEPWGGNLEANLVKDDGSTGAPVWDADARLKLKVPTERRIFTRTDSGGVEFTYSNLPTSYTGMTNQTDIERQNLASYIRGNRSLEGPTSYRIRRQLLGDIINSSPVLVGSGLDSQYDRSSAAGNSSYLSFLRTSKKSRPERVYVGANDGMLHAFNANTGDEEFAYIPKSLLGKLINLANPAYSHSYFVDGQITELDAYDTSTSSWRNLIVASTGAGAKTVFAINVPTGAAATAPGADDIRWEISNTSTSASGDFSELGHTLSKLEAGLMRNGEYAVLINNGYASASGKASLFVVNALTGALIKRIDTGVGSNSTAGEKNGLGGVRVIRNAAREIVAAYAGDLKGNMWKFDLSSKTSANWKLAFSPATSNNPLFKADLPITAAPGLIANPLGGLMVIFGTGKMFETADASNSDRGYIYSIWDKDGVGTTPNENTYLTNSNSLVEQTLGTVSETQSDGSVKTFYTSSNNPVDYANNRGWFIKLANSERVIYDPQAALGRIYVESVVRGANTSGVPTCNPGIFELNGYLLDPFTGSYNTARPTLDTNGDGKINSGDRITVIGYKSAILSRASVALPQKPGSKGVLVSAKDQKNFNGNQALVRRAWRHIVTPP